jgi:segregation and condensation protein A
MATHNAAGLHEPTNAGSTHEGGIEAPIRASVAEALMELLDLLPALGSVSFRDLTDGIDDRIQVVCRFLAVLELYKQGRVDLDQADRFGDITIVWTAGDDRGFESALVIDNYEG